NTEHETYRGKSQIIIRTVRKHCLKKVFCESFWRRPNIADHHHRSSNPPMIQKESRAPGSAICSATSPFRGSPQPRAAPDNDRCEIEGPGATAARARQDPLQT